MHTAIDHHTFAAMKIPFFANVLWLNLLWLVPALLLILSGYMRWRKRVLQQLGPNAEQLISGFSAGYFKTVNLLLLSVVVLLGLVMANPLWGERKVSQSQKAADVIIAFDISKSMLAADIRPSRLVRARVFAQELVKKIAGNRIGLIFFAGDAYLSMPLSTDYTTLTSLLADADPEGYSAQGTSISSVMDLARKSFDPGSGAGRTVVIITDGEDHEDNPVDAIEEAYSDGIVTFMVGAGTTEGGEIPLTGGYVQRDSDGKPVLTQLNAEALTDMAEAGQGGGVYLLSRNDQADQLATQINNLPKREIAIRSFDEHSSIYQWLLLPAILLLFAVGFGINYRK